MPESSLKILNKVMLLWKKIKTVGGCKVLITVVFIVTAIFAPRIAAAAEQTQFSKTLKRGMKGAEVARLQNFLTKFQDVYPEKLISGYFGPLTEKAVKRFQRKNRILPTGVFGPKTRTKVNELFAREQIFRANKIQEKLTSKTIFPIAAPPEPPLTQPETQAKPALPAVEEKTSGETPLSNLPPQLPLTEPKAQEEPTPPSTALALKWAEEQGIKLVGVNRTLKEFRTRGQYDAALDSVPLEAVTGVNIFFQAASRLPTHLLELLRGETIYISNQACGSHVGNYLHIFDPEAYSKKIVFVPAGLYSSWGNAYIEPQVMFLCQYFDEFLVTHEIAHMVDYIGLGMGKGRDLLLEKSDEEVRLLYDEFERIFKVPEIQSEGTQAGFLTPYSTTNHKENFAEHFASYVINPEEFRNKAQADGLLQEKYKFLKTKIFLGKEY